jgi:hypothetical protein
MKDVTPAHENITANSITVLAILQPGYWNGTAPHMFSHILFALVLHVKEV